MRRRVVVWLVSVVALFGAAGAQARNERQLTEDELRAEMARNQTMAAYVNRNGLPDLAQTRFLADRPPWDDHEVTLYYFDAHKEIGFARALILGRPDIQITRYERDLTDEEIAALSNRARLAPTTQGLGPDERAEAAALRAENAAGRVEAAAATAERAAERAEAVTARMETSFHRALRK
jgi:hypothetical protein